MPMTVEKPMETDTATLAEKLKVVDERTGRSYDVPDRKRTIRGTDLKRIKSGPDDSGLMVLRPGVHEHGLVQERASRSSTGTRGSCATAATRSRSWPRTALTSRSPTCSSTASCPDREQYDEWARNITFHTMIHESLKKVHGRASTTTRIRWEC